VTLSAGSGALASQVSTFTYAGQVLRGGTNAVVVTARADTTQVDGLGNLSRPASRLVLASNQSGFTDLVHGGGIVVAKGNIAASGASPFGSGGNAVTMSRVDSTLGGMVPDGQTVATFSRSTTAAASRGRLGAVANPAGGAGTQTVNYNGTFAWNDATSPLFVAMTPGSPGAATALASWTGLFADPGTVLQFGGVGVAGGALDNVTAFANGAPSASVPVYVGGGGTVRFAANFDENTYRNAAAVRGLAGTVTVLDNTTLQSQTQGRHFDGVDVRAGTYQVSAFHQTLSGGFSAGVSLTEPTRTSGNVHVDTGLTLTVNGTGPGRTFRVGGGATLVKTGAGTLTVTGDQAHAGGSTLAVNQGTVNLNTDAGGNGAGAPVNNLSITAAGGQVNLTGNQHVRVVTVTGGLVRLNAGPTTGSRVIEATGVAATGGRLDLTNGRLVVDYAPGNSPIASVRAQIISGFNAGGTPWAGNGIVSSSIADAIRFGVGYGEASDLLGAGGGSFGPEAVDGSAVLARYTMLGDATLDGLIDFNDLVKVAQNYNNVSGAMLWSQGDFTYDGRVDFNDLIKVAQNYNTALPSDPIPFAAAFEQDLAAAFASVPEPGAIGFVGVAGLAVLSRRRRR
jgi:autotransporter-associated beta strand protein